MAEIRLSRHARADLDEIWTYIARDKSEAADRFVELLVSKFPTLAEHPELGRSRPELAAEVRSFPVKNYLILYRSRPGVLEIVRVVSGYRDLESLLR